MTKRTLQLYAAVMSGPKASQLMADLEPTHAQ